MVQNTFFLQHFSLKRLAMIFYGSDHFFAASQGNIDNAFSARELRCLCTSNSDRAWNSNFPKKTRLSKEMKPDGLICIGIVLKPSITGIRPSSLLGVRTEGWNKRSFQPDTEHQGSWIPLVHALRCHRHIHWLTLSYGLERIVLNLLFLPLLTKLQSLW